MQVADADFSEARLRRLKFVLGKDKDKEIAELLGLGEKAFNARKSRNSFPIKELRALAQQRPELGLDVDYVLSGVARLPDMEGVVQARVAAMARVSPQAVLPQPADAPPAQQEKQLLTDFRACDVPGRAALLLVAQAMARR